MNNVRWRMDREENGKREENEENVELSILNVERSEIPMQSGLN